MCVEAFAIGHAITVRFLHEQVWFEVGHDTLKVTEVCDWFIKNESPRDIEMLRLQFPYYIAIDDIHVDSMAYVENDRYSWYGALDYNANDNSMAFRCSMQDDAVSSIDDGLINASAVHAAVKLPACTSRVKDYIDKMYELNRMVVDIVLDEPIRKGQTGWLRIRVAPTRWPLQAEIVHRPTLPFLKSAHHFVARLSILSPKHLRKELRKSFKRPAYRVFEGELIKEQGWKTPGTLSRIEDHRITLVVPKDVSVVDLVAVPYSTVLRITPYWVPDSQDRYALHFATGSASQVDDDIVNMAHRIREYIATMMRDGSASVTHLVDRFGGSNHEVVGNFIDEMTKAGILHCVRQEPEGETFFGLSDNRAFQTQLINLRDAYTFPDSEGMADAGGSYKGRRRFLRMRDLHPFLISFTLDWVAFDSTQRERMSLLNNLIDEQQKLSKLTPFPRAAIVVGCSVYEDGHSYPNLPFVPKILDKLSQSLEHRGGFRTQTIQNPSTEASIYDAITAALEAVGEGGLLLFWFIGHGKPDDAHNDLNLLIHNSRHNIGVRWSVIASLFERYRRIAKIVVVDCCHAALVRKNLPSNSWIWPTAGEHEPAAAGAFEADPAGKVNNFSWYVAEFLEDRNSNDPRIITFDAALKNASELLDGGERAIVPLSSISQAETFEFVWTAPRPGRNRVPVNLP